MRWQSTLIVLTLEDESAARADLRIPPLDTSAVSHPSTSSCLDENDPVFSMFWTWEMTLEHSWSAGRSWVW